jgi:hypothetical protein
MFDDTVLNLSSYILVLVKIRRGKNKDTMLDMRTGSKNQVPATSYCRLETSIIHRNCIALLLLLPRLVRVPLAYKVRLRICQKGCASLRTETFSSTLTVFLITPAKSTTSAPKLTI